jgi:glutamate/tyrosine decarboxylase-like PLP-dependent enzyme
MRNALPRAGLARDEILARMESYVVGDVDWRRGRVPLYVFKANEDIGALGRDAFFRFFSENGLGAKRAFKGLKRMEDEIVAMGLSLLNAPDDAAGTFTTGGSESIIAIVKAARDWLRAESGRPDRRFNIVLPYSAHPAFTKAAMLMDIELRRVPLAANYRADVERMAQATDPDTLMLVGSAPCFPYGTIDPISALSDLAIEKKLWLHVDACVGGYLAPFVAKAGFPVPAWDFSVPGVTSISADLHKFEFCPKPASTTFYRSAKHAAFQFFECGDWPGGVYNTATIVGTRPGGAIAGAWATLQGLGEAGYTETARQIMGVVAQYRRGVEALGLRVLGNPELSILCFTADDVDMMDVGAAMAERGWLPGHTREPRSMHMMLSMLHAPAVDDYLADLKASLAQVRASKSTGAKLDATYS